MGILLKYILTLQCSKCLTTRNILVPFHHFKTSTVFTKYNFELLNNRRWTSSWNNGGRLFSVIHSQQEETGEDEGQGQSSKRNPTETSSIRKEIKSKQLGQYISEEDSTSSWENKILYSSYLQSFQANRSFRKRLVEKGIKRIEDTNERVHKTWTTVPLSSKFLDDPSLPDDLKQEDILKKPNEHESEQHSTVHFPYKVFTKTEFKDVDNVEESQNNNISELNSPTKQKTKYKSEAEKLEKQGLSFESLLNRMDNPDEENEDFNTIFFQETGTPDPKIPSSHVPCGGCGAHLHCQDQSIPGYMPSERFKNLSEFDLRGEICLRCYGLQAHDTALNVNVSPEDYPKVLKAIDGKFALVVLLVDLTDFPCSIWPGIIDIIGKKRPVILVGNKVDLLPRDSENYLRHVEHCLVTTAKYVGLKEANVVKTALISATTGFGVENLISVIYQWGMKGDVFIMGCTNVGKSSLYNALIQSDMCKTHVADLVQRATISQWPGTTLNLLKFPVMRADPWRIAQRTNRLSSEIKILQAERKEQNMLLRMTKSSDYSTLWGHVGRTFLSREKADSIDNPWISKDVFSINFRSRTEPHIKKLGQWNPNDPELKGHWCYDTPGTVNKNQILDQLTLPELMKILPKKLIEPKTFFIKIGMTMFLGGVARIDFVEGMKPIRFTVFASNQMHITIVLTEDAEHVYEKGIGTPLFGIPIGDEQRLREFPKLKPTEYTLNGLGHKLSCADIVLSCAGWVAVTVGERQSCTLKVWTPNGNGVFCRKPALLPYTVNMKGTRIRDTPAYLPHRVFVPSGFKPKY